MSETTKTDSESSYSAGEAPKQRQFRPRSALFALILSLFLTGLGQAYAGKPKRGLAYLLCSGMAIAALYLSLRLSSAALMFFALLWVLALTVLSMIDAWRTTRRASPVEVRNRFDRWPTYVAIVVLWSLVSPSWRAWLESWIGRAYKIPSASMEPTILVGDFIMSAPIREMPRHDELIVYRTENGPMMKRVVGLPHDTIAMRNGVLVRNGKSVNEPYRLPEKEDPVIPEFDWQRSYVIGRDTAGYQPSLKNWGPLVVPTRAYFLLGDNRGGSLDSRYKGFTPQDSLWLSPRFIYFSWSYNDQAVRWGRIGTRVR